MSGRRPARMRRCGRRRRRRTVRCGRHAGPRVRLKPRDHRRRPQCGRAEARQGAGPPTMILEWVLVILWLSSGLCLADLCHPDYSIRRSPWFHLAGGRPDPGQQAQLPPASGPRGDVIVFATPPKRYRSDGQGSGQAVIACPVRRSRPVRREVLINGKVIDQPWLTTSAARTRTAIVTRRSQG